MSYELTAENIAIEFGKSTGRKDSLELQINELLEAERAKVQGATLRECANLCPDEYNGDEEFERGWNDGIIVYRNKIIRKIRELEKSKQEK